MSPKIKTSVLIAFAILLAVPVTTGTTVSAQENSICGWLNNVSDTGAYAPTLIIWITNEEVDFWTPVPLNLSLPGYFRFYDAVLHKPETRSYRVVTSFSRMEKVVSCQTQPPQPTRTIQPQRTQTPQSTQMPQPTQTTNQKCELKTPTGFIWPTCRVLSLNSNDDNYLFNGCNGNKSYAKDKVHIGTDIFEKITSPVYAIADGVVIDISYDGWDLTTVKKNAAVLIKHTLSDGKTSFIAIYGHMLSASLTVSEKGAKKTVEAGQLIGTIGDWGDEDHLHFGVFEGASIQDPNKYGRWPCGAPGTNGTVDPINWLLTRTPLGSLESAIKPESLDYVRVGSSPPSTWMLTYDSNLWSVEINEEPSGKIPPSQLVMKGNQGCIIRQHVVKTMPDNWKNVSYQKSIGDYSFDVYEFSDKSNGRTQLIVFASTTTGPGQINDIYIEITPGQDHSRCFSAALRVIEFSVQNKFGPFRN